MPPHPSRGEHRRVQVAARHGLGPGTLGPGLPAPGQRPAQDSAQPVSHRREYVGAATPRSPVPSVFSEPGAHSQQAEDQYQQHSPGQQGEAGGQLTPAGCHR